MASSPTAGSNFALLHLKLLWLYALQYLVLIEAAVHAGLETLVEEPFMSSSNILEAYVLHSDWQSGTTEGSVQFGLVRSRVSEGKELAKPKVEVIMYVIVEVQAVLVNFEADVVVVRA